MTTSVNHVILQNVNTAEVRACRFACLLGDMPVKNASLDNMLSGAQQVAPDTLLVGSVEFVKAGLDRLDILQDMTSYPAHLDQKLCRRIEKTSLKQVLSSPLGHLSNPLQPSFLEVLSLMETCRLFYTLNVNVFQYGLTIIGPANVK